MERYKLTIAYDGTAFKGFQRQGTARTVQAELETALRRLGWQGRAILSSGRTDTGVHASGQVVAFDLEWSHGPEALSNALNAGLPEDVAVQEAVPAAPEFHPRFDARERCYRYRLLFAPQRDPLRERYAWRLWPALAVERLSMAAQTLHGTHDFAAFGAPMRPGGSTRRTVYQASWQVDGQECLSFAVTANAFLYHMVRRMVFLQVRCAQERISLEALREAVDAARPLQQGLAPPHGLVLEAVRYAGDRSITESQDDLQ